MRTYSLGPLTLHVTSRPFRFSILEAGRPLLAQRARREGGSLELLGEDGWRRAGDVLAIRTDESRGGPSRLLVEASLEDGGSVEVRFAWSASRGSLEISSAAPKAAYLGVREDFVTLPDEARLVFGPAREARSMRRLVLGPRFALLAGGTGAAGGKAEAPRVFEPDPDALRIQVEGATLILELIPGAPREALARIRGFGESSAGERAAAGSLLWIDARSTSFDLDGERLRSLMGSASLGVPAGVLLEKDGAASFRSLSGDAVGREPRSVVVDGWDALRAVTASAIETAVLGAEPRVILLPDETGSIGTNRGLWERSIAAAALQPAVALRWDIVAACAAGGPIEPGDRVESVRIARRLLRARAVLESVLCGAPAPRGGPGRGLIPLFVEHPEEEGAWEARDEWLVGPDILVAPVLEEGAESRAVYFPTGTWRDLRASPDGPGFRGPARRRVEIARGEIGVFAREGGDAELARALAEALRGP